jgi:hypothetical protein
MSELWRRPFVDPLYRTIEFDENLLALVRTAVVQRLRHVRLSNIDSIDIPSIANLSRFEHVLGVAHLAEKVGFRSGLSGYDHLVLKSSALLHDWAITSFGHLVEEALQYVGTRFDHEEKLSQILTGQTFDDIGGADMQILAGRETGLRGWARRAAGADGHQLLLDIMDHIRGRGRMGRVIAGDIDLDNIDNVFRMAFHMGIPVNREIPGRIAAAIVGVVEDVGEPVFRVSAEADIENWRETRRQVYESLMLAERDFIGKLMILFATIKAYEHNEISSNDWNLVDYQFVERLLNSPTREVQETAKRWIAGELWHGTPLHWLDGERPEYPKLLELSGLLTGSLGRHCFAYAIKDKRDRRLSISYDDGSRRVYGTTPRQWLLGVGSTVSRAFTIGETRKVFDIAASMFGTRVIAPALKPSEGEEQPCLF